MTDEIVKITKVDEPNQLIKGDRLRRTDGQLTDSPVAEHSPDADEHVLAVRKQGTNELEKAGAFNASRCATCGFWHVTDCPACCLKQPMARCICKDENQQRSPKKQLQEAVLVLAERIKTEPQTKIEQHEALDALANIPVLQAENGALRREIAVLKHGLEETTKQAVGFELQMQDILKKFHAVQRRDAISDQTFNALQKELTAARADLAASHRETDDLVKATAAPWETLLKEARAKIVDLEGRLEAVGRNMRLAQDNAETLRVENEKLKKALKG